jgi:hypothetical protein
LDDRQANNDHCDDCDDLDQRKPEFNFTEKFHRGQVCGVQEAQSYQGGDPLGNSRKPVMNINTDGGDLRHADSHPHEPIGPASHEPRPRPDKLCRIGGKGSRNRPVEQQLAKSAHDQKQDQSANGIGHHQPRTSLLDRCDRTKKQTDADRSANGDHLDMPVLESTVEVFLRARLLFVQRLPHHVSLSFGFRARCRRKRAPGKDPC